MRRSSTTSCGSPMKLLIGTALLVAATASAYAQRPAGDSTRGANENDYYRLLTVPIPEGVVLEVGGLEMLPDGRLAVATRRGEVWIVENPGGANGGRPHYTRF